MSSPAKYPQKPMNNGYTEATAVALDISIYCKLLMYNVSPIAHPTIIAIISQAKTGKTSMKTLGEAI